MDICILFVMIDTCSCIYIYMYVHTHTHTLISRPNSDMSPSFCTVATKKG